MNIKAFQIENERGRPDLLFVEVTELGGILYEKGQAKAWYIGGESNVEISPLIGDTLKKVTDMKK